MKRILYTLILIANFCSAQECDTEILKHIYNPNKYIVYYDCRSISGVVNLVTPKSDGSISIQFKMDPTEDEDFINEYNKRKENGCMVAEIICAGSINDNKEISKLCKKYKSKVYVPQKDEHIKATGRLVLNRESHIIEIYPVSQIEIIK